MIRSLAHCLTGLLLLLGATTVARAQVKQIQMKIDGYLCGN